MPFVQAKCPNCGGILAVNSSNDAAVCQFCDTPFVVEKAVNNYNTTNNITIESGANVYISGEPVSVNESKIIVRIAPFLAPVPRHYDVVGLFDEQDNLIISLNPNEVKSKEIDKDMVLTAHRLTSDGTKQTLYGPDAKSNSVKVTAGKVTHLEIKFLPGYWFKRIRLSDVDRFVDSKFV